MTHILLYLTTRQRVVAIDLNTSEMETALAIAKARHHERGERAYSPWLSWRVLAEDGHTTVEVGRWDRDDSPWVRDR